MEQIIKKLMLYSKKHDLNKGLSENLIRKFENDNKIFLPSSLKIIYSHFDGGELFVPGTRIYGIYENEESIKIRNAKNIRQQMSLPANYLIVAKLNYGDLICLDLNEPYKVIQWSHETDEAFCEWDNLEQWLSETITDFEEYEAGEQ